LAKSVPSHWSASSLAVLLVSCNVRLIVVSSHTLVAPLNCCFLFCCMSGFTPGARELFKHENHLALYQLPSGEKAKESAPRRLHHFTKRQPPISHLISLFVRDSTTSTALFFCPTSCLSLAVCLVTDLCLLNSLQIMCRCSPTARPTSSWKPARISGTARTSIRCLALIGQRHYLKD